MNAAIVYIYPANSGSVHTDYAFRFILSYQENPPRVDHQTIVVLNGAKETSEIRCMFSPLPKVTFLERDDSGWDIGGYQDAAKKFPCDMMVFFSGSTYFQRSGWLLRMASAFQKHGNAQYGAMGNRGHLAVNVWPHIRTTAFWMDPKLMNACPYRVTRQEQRHPFEHGKNCFTSWVTAQGLKSWVITWTKELLWQDWDSDPNGYSRGNQSNILAGDRMCEPPYFRPKYQGQPVFA